MRKLLSLLGATAIVALTNYNPVLAQEYTLQFGHYLTNGPFLDVEKEFIENVEKRTDNRVKFNLVYSGGLGAGDEVLGLTGKGAIDITAVVPGYYPNQLLYTKALQIPFVFDSPAEAIKIAEYSFKNLPAFQNEMDKLGVHYLFMQPLGSYYLTGKSDACTSIEALKGKKIRSFGSEIPKMIDAVGGTPVSVPVNDLYEAVDRGTLDYSFLPLGNVEDYRLYEVGEYSCGPVHSYAGHMIVMSKRLWDRFPEDIRTIFTEESDKAQKRYVEWQNSSQQSSIDNITKAGGKVVELPADQLSAWMQATPDLLQGWVDAMAGRGEGDAAQEVADKWREMTGSKN